MNAEAERIITTLGLAPLPREGGYFRQTWRDGNGSAIYFLLTPGEFSALHRLKTTTEVWHYYAGDPVEHVMLAAGDAAELRTILGHDLNAGQLPQLVVPAGVWQGARLAPESRAGWALLGCTLAPAWDENDFELAGRAALEREFVNAGPLIRSLTR